MTDSIPRIIRFLNQLSLNISQYDLLVNNFDNKIEELNELYTAITTNATKHEMNEALKYISIGKTPIELLTFHKKCQIFECVDTCCYHLLYIISIMENKPTNLMPGVFKHITFPNQYNQHPLKEHQISVITFVVKNITQLTNRISKIPQIKEYTQLLPEYDRKYAIEKFVFMQFTQTIFYQMMRYFDIPILLETNYVFTEKRHQYEMTDKTFRQIAYIMSF